MKLERGKRLNNGGRRGIRRDQRPTSHVFFFQIARGGAREGGLDVRSGIGSQSKGVARVAVGG